MKSSAVICLALAVLLCGCSKNDSQSVQSVSSAPSVSEPVESAESVAAPAESQSVVDWLDAQEANQLLREFWTDIEANLSDYTLSGQAETELGYVDGLKVPLPTESYPEVSVTDTPLAQEILAMVQDDNYLYQFVYPDHPAGDTYVLLQSPEWELRASGCGFRIGQTSTGKWAYFWSPNHYEHGHDEIYYMLTDWYEEASGTAFASPLGHEKWHNDLADDSWYDFYTS